MGLLSKIFRRSKHSGTQADTPVEFSAGDKVYISTFVSVHEGEIVAKDESTHPLRSGRYFIVKIPKTGEVVSVGQYMLTKAGTGGSK